MANIVALIGPMGAGKTTIGKLLATAMNLDFVDMDAELQTRTGVTISTIFEIEGEEGFRHREACLLEQLLERENVVLSTGGGVVVREMNRHRLKQLEHVVYLKANANQIYHRVKYDKKRPLLAVKDPKAAIRNLLEERSAWYESTASHVIETYRKSPKKITADILSRVSATHTTL